MLCGVCSATGWAGMTVEITAWGGAAEDHAAAADAYARLWTRSQMEDAPLE